MTHIDALRLRLALERRAWIEAISAYPDPREYAFHLSRARYVRLQYELRHA